jgi:predicted AlkP superfamily pyrophosphatase or phosphodiesterase
MIGSARVVTLALATVVGVAGMNAVPAAQLSQHHHHWNDWDDPDAVDNPEIDADQVVADDGQAEHATIAHVLLLSVDGLHAFDVERFIATHPQSTLARLSEHGRTYANATATKPSDSFPGFLAMITGGTPRSTGVYYDDGYDRTLASAGGLCIPGARVQWKQNLGVLPFSFTTTINPLLLPRDPADACVSRVWPHQFPRVNNVFEIVKASGGRTGWSDKHPAYEFVNGPSGTGIDDLYTPEITLNPPAVTTTNSFALTMAYDDMKVAAIVNEINGLDHTGTTAAGTPALFGMNFQAVSVGQKLKNELLLTAPALSGGYLDASGTPSDGLQTTLEHTDASIGKMVAALEAQGLADSTVIIISAKHGNSPVDPATLVRVNPAVISTIVNTVAPGLLALLSADTGPLIWLTDQSRTADVVAALNQPANRAAARIAQVLSGTDLTALFPDPLTDARAPDIILVPEVGTVYTTSLTKIADHGGFGDDDVHVALLVSHTSLPSKKINDRVETRQIACTILKALALECNALASQQVEPSKSLPHSNHKNQ